MAPPKRVPVELGADPAAQESTKKIAFDGQGHVPSAWLKALGEGDLPETEREHVMAHVVTCDTCRHAAAGLGLEATVRFDPNVMVLPSQTSESLIGQQVGEYKVEAVLDEGAMGIVYRGVHPVIGKPVAIKVMRKDFARDTENSHRLIAEARAVNAIAHPNIVDVFSFGTLPDGRQYLVMELLTGKNLRVLGRDEGVSLLDGLDILTQAAAALGAAHAAGVVHRDLKPSNIFISRNFDALRVTVLDFGVAKGVGRRISAVSTEPGMMIGTVGFMSPEQILGRTVGPPADIYALGCVAWWLFAREEVFTSRSDDELYRLHVEAAPPALSMRARIPPALDALVGAMLDKRPEARPTAGEAQQRFARLLAEVRTPAPVTSSEVPTQPPMAPVRRSGPRLPAGAAVEAPLAANTVVDVPQARARPRAAQAGPPAGAASEETVKPARSRSGRALWVVVALIAAAIAAFSAFKLGLLPPLR